MTQRNAVEIAEEAASDIQKIWSDLAETQQSIWSTNYALQFMEAVSKKAQEIARKRAEEDKDAEKRLKEREAALNRIESIRDSAYQANLRQNEKIIELINYRRDQEVAALEEAGKKAIENGAKRTEVEEKVAEARKLLMTNAEDEIAAYEEKKRQERIRKEEETARAIVSARLAARRFNLDMMTGAASDAQRSVGMWQGSGISTFDPEIAGAQVGLERDEKMVALQEMQAERIRLARETGEEIANIEAEFAERRNAVQEEFLRRQILIQQETAAAAMQNAQTIFGSLTKAAATAFGEQSAIFKAALVAEKTVAIARAIMGIQAGMAQALALPFPANLAAYAQVAALGTSIIANLQSVSTAIAGKREWGGSVNAGMMYEVNERNKPEMFESGGKRYMMPGQNGKVTPFQQVTSSNDNKSTVKLEGKISIGVPEGVPVELDRQAQEIIEIRRIASTASDRAVAAVADDFERGGGPVSAAAERGFGLNRGFGT